MGIHAIFTLLTQDIAYDPINLIRYFPVSLCYILSMALSFFGIRYIEESIADPVENTSGAICFILTAVFLGKAISLRSILAVAAIAAGILGIGFLEQRSDRKQKLGRKMAIVAFAMPFAYAIIDALGSFLDIYYLDIETTPLAGVSAKTIEQVANTSYELTFFICAAALLAFLKTRGESFNLPSQKDKIIAAICETGGQFTYVFAMSGNGLIAAPIISSVCVVSLLLSRIVLHEKLTSKQYFFIALVIVGILIIA